MKTKLIVLLAFMAVPLFAQQAPPEPDFAPFSIVSERSVRINAVLGPQPHLYPPGPCDGAVQLRFINGRGDVLAEKIARVSANVAASLVLNAPPEPERVRPQISWVEVPPGPCRGNLIANVEVYDNATGRTLFVVPGQLPPPDPDFAPLTLVDNLSARINAVMGTEAHLDCVGVIHLRFLDATGNVLIDKSARFTPTAVESLEYLPPPEPDRVGRTLVRPQVTVEYPPGPCRGTAIVNVEVLNNTTGETLLVVPGN